MFGICLIVGVKSKRSVPQDQIDGGSPQGKTHKYLDLKLCRAGEGDTEPDLIPSSAPIQTALYLGSASFLPLTLPDRTYEPNINLKKKKERKGEKELRDRGVGGRTFSPCMCVCFPGFFPLERLIS